MAALIPHCITTFGNSGPAGPDRVRSLALSATRLPVVAAAVLPQDDPAPQIARRHTQFDVERRVVSRPVRNQRANRRAVVTVMVVMIVLTVRATAHGTPPRT